MLSCGASASVANLRPCVSLHGSRRSIARVRAVYDFDRAEEARLEAGDAFKELQALSRKQSVNKPQRVRYSGMLAEQRRVFAGASSCRNCGESVSCSRPIYCSQQTWSNTRR